jgi:hypothetical protein
MPPYPFPSPVNNYAAILALPYTPGDPTFRLASGMGAALVSALAELTLPPPSPANPVRLRVALAGSTNRAARTIFEVTDLVGDDAGGLAVVDGSADQGYPAGSPVDAYWTAEMYKLVCDQINAIRGDPTILRSTASYQDPDWLETLDGAKLVGAIDPARLSGVFEPHTAVLSQIGAVPPTFKGSLLVPDGSQWFGLPPGADGRFLVYDSTQTLGFARRLLAAGDVPDLSGTYQVAGSYQPRDPQLDDVAAIAPTKGRMLVGDGVNWQPLPVGADTQVITADAAQALGIKWAAGGGGGGGVAIGAAVTGGTWMSVLFVDAAGNLAQSNASFRFDATNGYLFVPRLNVLFNHVQANGTNDDLWLNSYVIIGANSHPGLRVGTAAIGTTATDGFLYLVTCAGQPTGTPTAQSGLWPFVVNSTLERPAYHNGSRWVGLHYTRFQATADATCAATLAETSLVGTGVGSMTIPAGAAFAGLTCRLTIRGVYSTSGSPGNLTIKVKLGASVIGSATTSPGGGLTNLGWEACFDFTFRASGAGGSAACQGWLTTATGTTSANNNQMRNANAIAIDTTGALLVDVTATWTSATAGNTITGTNCTLEIL